jgi:transcriptional regulator with XRE-family HTH domain
VCQRMRDRRAGLGLTQQQMADLIGVTYRQAQKYEMGTDRISAGRLYQIAQALGVHINHFFEGMDDSERGFKLQQEQRLLLELARNFITMPSRKHQAALCDLARFLVTTELAEKERHPATP